jgi:hypothetical protein
VKSRIIMMVAVLVLLCGSAFAWPSCSGNWIQVPAGTSNANGAVVTENGQTFQCQKTPITPTPQPITSVSSANSVSGASSNSSSNSTNKNSNTNNNANNNTATGGAGGAGGAASASSNQSQGQKQGQSQTATGGQGGSASVSGVGNGANNSSYSNQTNVAAPVIPANTALANAPLTTANCYKGYGAAGQAIQAGGGIAFGKIDSGCDAREDAKYYAALGSRLAACKRLVHEKKSRKAGITLEDCMTVPPPPPVLIQQTPAPVAPPPVVITVVAPAPTVLYVKEYETSMTVTAPKSKKRTTYKPKPCPKISQEK